MRRSCRTIWLVLICLAISSAANAAPPPPTVSAESAILIDATTGKVLYEKRCRTRRPPASTTKIMTAILALEHGDLDSVVSVSKKASSTPFSSLHLKEGEQLSFRDLMYGLMVRSGNDAAVCVAETIAGSEENFIAMMNAKAKAIGANDTNFVNPHGLHHAQHYSTAYDLALMARYAIRLPMFNDLVNTKTARIERSTESQDVLLRSTARFLWRFDGADGIKTGYTNAAGRCFVGSATRDDWRLISVVLKSGDVVADTTALLDYGFNRFQQVSYARENRKVTSVPIRGAIEEQIDLIARDDLTLIINRVSGTNTSVDINVRRVSAPVEKGDKLGTLTGYVNGEEVGTVDLLAAKSMDRTLAATVWLMARILLLILVIGLTGFVTYGTAIAKTSRRRRFSLSPRS